MLRDTCAMAARPMLTVVVSYTLSVILQLILAIVLHVIESDRWSEEGEGKGGFSQSAVFVVTTFVGGSYGDTYPLSHGGRIVTVLVSTCGYLLQLFHIVLVVQTVLNLAAQDGLRTSPSAFAKFRLLLPIYLVVVCIALLLGLLIHAVSGIDDGENCNEWALAPRGCAGLLDALYLLWVTTHGTTFGELIPGNAGGRIITWLVMAMNYFLTIGFAALAAIPNQRQYNFVEIPLLQAQRPPTAMTTPIQEMLTMDPTINESRPDQA